MYIFSEWPNHELSNSLSHVAIRRLGMILRAPNLVLKFITFEYQRKSNLLFKKISSNAIAKIVFRLSFWAVYSVTTQENGISRNMKSIFRKKWYLIISQCNSHFFSLLEWYVAWLGEKKASQGKPNQFFESIDFCWYRKICISSHFYGGVQRM